MPKRKESFPGVPVGPPLSLRIPVERMLVLGGQRWFSEHSPGKPEPCSLGSRELKQTVRAPAVRFTGHAGVEGPCSVVAA